MSELFLKVVNMSISASWLILAVLICRLVLKKAPKWVNVSLWGIVAVRLLLPFSIESAWSLIPSSETISPDIMMDASPTIHTGVPVINSAVNPVISQSFAPSPGASANPLQIWIPVAAWVWVIGAAGLLAYTAISYWRLRRRIETAVLVRDNIFRSENVGSPFVLGIIRPRIYLPFKLDGQDMEQVVAHELVHIERRDHWWKPLGFLLLAVHWFNPLMWLAYALLCRDIELACDEKVIRELDNERRADYTQALLACSAGRRTIAACPLAFGEVGVKERVKSVMNYKKPAFWIVILAVIVCGAVAVCFLTDPENNEIEMVPTTANMQGAYDRYLYVPLEDGTYRYEESDSDPRSVTLDELVCTFTEKAEPYDVEWRVYTVKEFPDRHVVCTVAGNTHISLYEYSPPKSVDPSALENAKKRGWVVMENGEGTYGAEKWKKFYEATQNGKPASVKVVNYRTLDPARYARYPEGVTYCEVNKLKTGMLAVPGTLGLYGTALAAEGSRGFSGVPDDAWCAEAVAYVRDRGLMVGTSDTTFPPIPPLPGGRSPRSSTGPRRVPLRPAVPRSRMLLKPPTMRPPPHGLPPMVSLLVIPTEPSVLMT